MGLRRAIPSVLMVVRVSWALALLLRGGTVDPEFSMTPLTVVIRNAGANPVSGQEVTLVDKTGRSIGTQRTNADGKAILKRGCLMVPSIQYW